jgi:hypothetical protein
VGFDVGAKAQAMTVEIGLAAAEIVLHRVEINHRAWRIQVLDKQLFLLLRGRESAGAHVQRDWSRPDNRSIARSRPPRITLRHPSKAFTIVISAIIVTSSTAPAIVPR